MASYKIFKEIPPWNIVSEILTLLKLDTSFPKRFERSQTSASDSEVLEQIALTLWPYYTDANAKKYLDSLSELGCMTVLRQILLPHGYVLSSRDTTQKGRHKTVYSIDTLAELSSKALPCAVTVAFG